MPEIGHFHHSGSSVYYNSFCLKVALLKQANMELMRVKRFACSCTIIA